MFQHAEEARLHLRQTISIFTCGEQAKRGESRVVTYVRRSITRFGSQLLFVDDSQRAPSLLNNVKIRSDGIQLPNLLIRTVTWQASRSREESTHANERE